MRSTFLFILVAFVLVSCGPVQTPLPVTSTPPIVVTGTPIPSSTPLPTNTQTATITPTRTATVKPTLSPEQYPSLSSVVIKVLDIPDDGTSYFKEYFWGSFYLPPEKRAQVVVKDITEDLISQGRCELDCSMQLWTSSSQLSATITMILTKNHETAQSLSQNLCFDIARRIRFEVSNYEDCQKKSNEFGLPLPSPDAWVLPLSNYERYFGATYGAVFISIRLYQLNAGDDGGVNVQILFDMAIPQVENLVEAGFPAGP